MPRGGTALYIEGPGSATAAPLRTKGIQETKPSNIQVRAMKGKWTEESGYNAIASWLRLTTSRDVQIGAVIAQNDAMAAGARRAFQELTKGTESDKWLSVPFTGVDGLKKTGAAWVDSGMLAATIVMPANAGTGLEMIVKAVESGQQPPEQSFTQPRSYPALERITVPKSSTVRL